MVSTSATALGTAVGIVSAIDSAIQLREINDKLSTVVSLQKQILSEIRALRIHFDQALYEAFLTDVSRDLQAQLLRYDVVSAGISNPGQLAGEQRQKLQPLLDDVEQTAFKLLTYGPAVYQASGAAMVLLKTLYTLLKTNEASRKRAFSKFSSRVREWIGDQATGVEPLLLSTTRDRDQTLESFRRAIQDTSFVRYGGPVSATFRLEGHIDSGVVLYRRILTGKWEAVSGQEDKIYATAVHYRELYLRLKEQTQRLDLLLTNLKQLGETAEAWAQ